MPKYLVLVCILFCAVTSAQAQHWDFDSTAPARTYKEKLQAQGLSDGAIGLAFVLAMLRVDTALCGAPPLPDAKIDEWATQLRVPIPVYRDRVDTYAQLVTDYIHNDYRQDFCHDPSRLIPGAGR
jgi:hypothetical protein